MGGYFFGFRIFRCKKWYWILDSW